MTSEQKTWARIGLNLGRYNFASNAKDWCLSLSTSGGNFSETWPEDEKPDIEGLMPSEVMDMLVKRLQSYWISTRREETLARVKKWQESASKYDDAWLVAQIEGHEEAIHRLKRRLEEVRDAEEAAIEATGASHE